MLLELEATPKMPPNNSKKPSTALRRGPSHCWAWPAPGRSPATLDAARQTYADLGQVWHKADPDLPELDEVKQAAEKH